MKVLKKLRREPNGTVSSEEYANPLAICEPLGDRVVIKRDRHGETIPGSRILLPETAMRDKQQIGTVISVGPGKTKDGTFFPCTLKPGDRVIITGYAGLEVRDGVSRDDDDYIILRQEDVLAKLPQ